MLNSFIIYSFCDLGTVFQFGKLQLLQCDRTFTGLSNQAVSL